VEDKAKELLLGLLKINKLPDYGSLEKPERSYIDGAFDLVYCGHFNAIRKAAMIS